MVDKIELKLFSIYNICFPFFIVSASIYVQLNNNIVFCKILSKYRYNFQVNNQHCVGYNISVILSNNSVNSISFLTIDKICDQFFGYNIHICLKVLCKLVLNI